MLDWIGRTSVDGARQTCRGSPTARLQAGAARYLSNLARMRDLTTAGRRPVHRRLPAGCPAASAFRVEASVRGRRSDCSISRGRHGEIHARLRVSRLGECLRPGTTRPYLSWIGDITDETVFVDEVHLYDPGNEIVARHLSRTAEISLAKETAWCLKSLE